MTNAAPIPRVDELASVRDPIAYAERKLAQWKTIRAAALVRRDRAAVRIADAKIAEYARRAGGR